MMKKIIIVLVILSFLLVKETFAQSFEELMQSGQEAYDKGDYPEAIFEMEKAININSNVAAAYNALGLAHQANGAELSKIVWCFKVALEIDPQFWDAYTNIAKAYSDGGDFNNAENYLKQALALNPGLLNAHYALAWIYLQSKSQPQEAITHFQQVLARSQIPMAYFGLGVAYAESQQSHMVLEIITKLRSLKQDDLAIQLEGMIRQPYLQPSAEPPSEGEVAADADEGILIKSGKEEAPAPVEQAQVPSAEGQETAAPGTIRVRLRGKLFNVNNQ